MLKMWIMPYDSHDYFYEIPLLISDAIHTRPLLSSRNRFQTHGLHVSLPTIHQLTDPHLSPICLTLFISRDLLPRLIGFETLLNRCPRPQYKNEPAMIRLSHSHIFLTTWLFVERYHQENRTYPEGQRWLRDLSGNNSSSGARKEWCEGSDLKHLWAMNHGRIQPTQEVTEPHLEISYVSQLTLRFWKYCCTIQKNCFIHKTREARLFPEEL